MRFSQKVGKTPVRAQLQIESMDNELRVALWNIIYKQFFEKKSGLGDDYERIIKYQEKIWADFFNQPINNMRRDIQYVTNFIQTFFLRTDWFRVYDFIEFICKEMLPDDSHVIKALNHILEKEMSAYRIIKGEIVRITDATELDEIEGAIDQTETSVYSGVNTHLKSALEKLSDRKNPDYRNSIKESISAVEGMVRIITEDEKATLGDALKKITGIHPALNEGFNKLYGYTSDKKGIRHALTERNSSVDFAEAKFMMVACSAFVNYLIMKNPHKNSGQ